MKRGLTLGKYAPFHVGHQSVVETALKEMDEVWVVIYDAPEETEVPLGIRAEWIRRRYPQVRVIEAWDGPQEVGYTEAIKRRHEEYLLTLLGDHRIDAFYSSEPYGEHVSQALGCRNRTVDVPRHTHPVSGSQVRENPYAYRQYLDPWVYRDLILNVVLLGAPSTGKTTLAERLAREYGTTWMPEYGREYWETHHKKRRLTETQLVEIADGHLEREDARLLEADRVLFTDTNILTTGVFSRYYHGRRNDELEQRVPAALRRYDLTFVCAADIPYADTWDRSGDGNRQVFQSMILGDLRERGIPYFLLKGSLEERVRGVKDLLEGYRKYMNLAEHLSRRWNVNGGCCDER